ncbi:hypothetical protein MNB_SM-3-302 [hydrothermal vent metagenome]|uniref:Uncharacterized protein n=1 Tax=hydrothermal vent metagenome TaxID=652676 RepID=A0A1W1D5C8_9ZZZZ
MLKKIVPVIFSVLITTTNGVAGDFCTPVPVTEVIGAANVLNDSTDLSSSLVVSSQKMLDLSNSLLEAGSTANPEYVASMLQLSQDILEMADKIGTMADRILVMADKIGDMSERILETQRIQNANIALTQANILQAQKNFQTILSR